MRNHRVRFSLTVLTVLLCRAGASSQPVPPGQTQIFLPPNVLLPNNESLPVGAVGGLEGNAYAVRTKDATSPWFNPAGLAGASESSASVSAGTFRFVTVLPEGTESTGSSVQSLPAAIGFVLKKPFGMERWTFGLSVARTAAWAQATDFQFVQGTDLRERTTSAADTEFDRTTLALAAGWTKGSAWRFGGGILADILYLRSVQSITYRRETESYVVTGIASNNARGSQVSLRLGLGAQADLSDHLKAGATLRTPGVRILPSGSYAADIALFRGAASTQASFFDGDTASFKYKLPFEGVIGLAWVAPRCEIEVDVKGQTAVSPYEGFESPRSVIFITDPGDGSRAAVTLTPFPGRTFEGRAVLNVSLGGRVSLDARGIWKLHAGFATDQSPVGGADEFFKRINLTSATIGVSGGAVHISGSLGLTYQFGTSGDERVVDLAGGTLAVTSFKVSNFGILYSVSYVF